MITQFTINLNKGEDIAEREARWRKRREIITMTLLFIAVVVLLAINIQQYQRTERIMSTKERIIRDIDRQLDSLQKTGKNISKEDVLALAKLEKERVLWTKKLLALGELIPEEMAVTFVEYKNNVFLIRFISKIDKKEKEFDRIKGIVDKLRASPLFFHDFIEMKLKESHRSDMDEQAILSFSVVCNLGKAGVERRAASRRGASAIAESVGR